MTSLTWKDAAEKPRRLDFDAVVSDNHSSGSTISEHPIERGAPIADHVQPTNERVTFEITISNTPVRMPADDFTDGAKMIEATISTSPKSSGAEMITRGATANDRSQTQERNVQTSARVWMLDRPMDRVGAVWRQLQLLRRTRVVVGAITSLETYSDMIITNLTVPRTAENGRNAMQFTLELSKLRVVATQTVEPPAKREQKVNRGPKAAKEVESKEAEPYNSALFQLAGNK